jgi:hypothetical protein
LNQSTGGVVLTEQLKFQRFEDELLNPLSGHELSDVERFVANLLLDASRENPVGIRRIIEQVSRAKDFDLSERKVKEIIRSLRKDHAFPILASRKPPTGYWWCASADEMAEFIGSFRSQALDELHTLSKIVRHNYPALMGQLSLEDAR